MSSRKRRKTRSERQSIVHHRAFVPLIGAWAAALFALPIMVLPAATIARLTGLLDLRMLGQFAQPTLALVAGIFGCLAGILIASAISRSRPRNDHIVVEMAQSRLRSINPSRSPHR